MKPRPDTSYAGYLIKLPPDEATKLRRQIEDFMERKIAERDLAPLIQSLMDIGMLPVLPMAFTRMAMHLISSGACTVNGRFLH